MTVTADVREVLINGRWPLILPEHRAARPHWGEWTNDEGETYFGWEVARLNSMHANIQPGDVIYDIGTEEGDLSALFARWAGPSGSMYLFEPNPLAWPCIKTIWEANHLRTPAFMFEGFVGDVPDEAPIAHSDWPASAYDPIDPAHGFCQLNERPDIQRTTIDRLTALPRTRLPNIINIDVEGSELRVLVGARETLAKYRPLVYVSIHEAFMFEQYDESPIKLIHLMMSLGYDYRFLDYDHELHAVFHHPDGRRLR